MYITIYPLGMKSWSFDFRSSCWVAIGTLLRPPDTESFPDPYGEISSSSLSIVKGIKRRLDLLPHIECSTLTLFLAPLTLSFSSFFFSPPFFRACPLYHCGKLHLQPTLKKKKRNCLQYRINPLRVIPAAPAQPTPSCRVHRYYLLLARCFYPLSLYLSLSHTSSLLLIFIFEYSFPPPPPAPSIERHFPFFFLYTYLHIYIFTRRWSRGSNTVEIF